MPLRWYNVSPIAPDRSIHHIHQSFSAVRLKVRNIRTGDRIQSPSQSIHCHRMANEESYDKMANASKSLDSFLLSAVMIQTQGKQRVTVTIDAKLLSAVDRLSQNRSAAIEEDLYLWHRQQIEDQRQRFYLNRNSSSPQEEEWTQATQDIAIASWENEASS